MSRLSALEKRKLETLLRMGGGYVLDFTDRTLQEFVLDTVARDIFDQRYAYASGSKANRIRAFWKKESDALVAKLLDGLLQYGADDFQDAKLVEECRRIVGRLQKSAPVEDLDAIEPIEGGRAFEELAKSVRNAIEKSEPEAALDRLHTFVVKYIRVLCERQGIDTPKDKPLHSLTGEYVKSLKARNLVQSEMAMRILKSSISILEAFNTVRNDQSLAHDNPLLGYDEALLIFNNVASTIRFIASVEEAAEARKADDVSSLDDDLPF